jgi:lysophospholipase L1-like esterase
MKQGSPQLPKWWKIVATLLAVLIICIGLSSIWRYRHDRFFRNEVVIRLYALTTPRHERKLLVIGDSNIASMSCAGDFAGWRVLNLGVPGLRAVEMLGYISARAKVLPRFDAAILWIGVNDLLFDQGSAADAARNVLAILNELATVSARVAVVSQALLPNGEDAGLTARINRDLVAMNATIAQDLRPGAATVIAPFTADAAVRWEDFYSDGLHLNARGYGRVCAEAGRWLSHHE